MKHQFKYAIFVLSLLLVSCTDKTLDSGTIGDGIIRYELAGAGPEGTKASGNAGLSGSFMLADASGRTVLTVTGSVSDSGAMTKGTLVNTTGEDSGLSAFTDIVSSFQSKVYDAGGSLKYDQTVTWSPDDSEWQAVPTAYWSKGERYTFFSAVNLPGAQTATVSAEGISMSHSVPGSAVEQKDILFGHYSGSGGKLGRAEMSFEHPLTAVCFKYGQIEGRPSIKSISLGGLASSGTVTMDASGNIEWSGVTAYDKTVTQEGASSIKIDATTKLIGEPFIVIPQDLAGKNVTLTVTFTDDMVVEGTVSAGAWLAGKVNTYTLGYKKPLPKGALSGEFTVNSEGKKVHFSQGNLYWNGSEFKFETNQYDFQNGWSSTHVSHFYWSKAAPVAYDQSYTDPDRTINDVFFTNAATETAKSDFTVNGVSGEFRTLSTTEWQYLFSRSGKYKSSVSVCGKSNCIIIAPDDFIGTIADSYDSSTWPEAEAAGLVCLPAVGYRNGSTVRDTDVSGYYWSSTANTVSRACDVYFKKSEEFKPDGNLDRSVGLGVRLVTDSYVPSHELFGHEYVDLGLPSGLKWATCNVGAFLPEDYGEYFAWGEVKGHKPDLTLPKDENGSIHDAFTSDFASFDHSDARYSSYWDASKCFAWVNTPYQTQNTKSYSSTKWTKYLGSTTSEYKDPSATDEDALKAVLDPEDDAAHVNWGGTWRMPTKADFNELIENTTSEWTDDYNGSGVSGYILTSKADASMSIFLPAAGYTNDDDGSSLLYTNKYGIYRASSMPTKYSHRYGDVLPFHSSLIVTDDDGVCCCGQSVRPVSE